MPDSPNAAQVSPIRWALLGLKHSGDRRYRLSSVDDLREWLGSDISSSAVKAVRKFDDADDPRKLALAVQKLDLPSEKVGEAMEAADCQVKMLGHDDKTPGSFEWTYAPEVIEDAYPDGTVYMCKSVNGKKAMLAWDLCVNNTVVKVDKYEKYEMLGWEKLKDFPHGGRQIREQYGDELSDEVFEKLCGDDTSGNSRSVSSPSTEELTVSVGRRQRHRRKVQAESISKELESSGTLDEISASKLVLFPTTSERNLSEHWWIAGSSSNEAVGIANCNKSTYEYLSDHDEVWHIDDYIESAENHEVVTTEGKKPLGELALDDCVVYSSSDEAYQRFISDEVLPALSEGLAYMAGKKYAAPDLDGDETVVVISPSTAFRARPVLRNAAQVLHTGTGVRDIGNPTGVGHTYLLYARCRLSDWDWESPEMEVLANGLWNVELDDGVYELVETLASVHDADEPLYSETPQSRWN